MKKKSSLLKRQYEIMKIGLYRLVFFPFVKWIKAYKSKVIVAPGGYYDTKSYFEGYNYIGRGSFLTETSLGYASYVADDVYLAQTEIGKFSSVGTHVIVAVGEHPIRGCVSTCPSFFSRDSVNGLSYSVNDDIREYKYCDKRDVCVIIENDVWIGSNVTLLSGITIHNGAVIGAGSVVTKDVEPYGIYVGSPAKKIGCRFSKQEIDALLQIQWWNRDEEWIRKNAKDFENVKKIIKKWKFEHKN